MRRMIIAAALAAGFSCPAAAADAYMAITGSGVACTAASPCLTLSTALNVAGPGGRVFITTPGRYLGTSIQNNVSIHGAGPGSMLSLLDVNGDGLRVVITDVDIGNFAASSFFSGNGNTVTLENVRMTGGSTGVLATSTSLILKNVSIRDNSSGSGSGIAIIPNGQVVNISLEEVSISGGVAGLHIDATGGGTAKVSVKNSTFSNINGTAINAISTTGNIRLYVDGVSMVNNVRGIAVNGSRTIGWIGETTIAGNGTGVQRIGGGILMSFKNNYIYNNTTDGVPLPDSWTPPSSASGPLASSR